MHPDPLIISLKKPKPVGEPAVQRPVPQVRIELPEFKQVKKRRRVPPFVVFIGIGILLLLTLGASAAYLLHTGVPKQSDPAHLSQSDIDSLVSKVGALMLLPPETPTIATVTDLNALAGQTFFANAAVGDKVLMFPQAGRAILYDPTSNKIIEVAPITGGAGK